MTRRLRSPRQQYVTTSTECHATSSAVGRSSPRRDEEEHVDDRRTTATLGDYEAIGRELLANVPLLGHLGVVVGRIEPGVCTELVMERNNNNMNHYGVFLGGALVTMCDVVAGVTAATEWRAAGLEGYAQFATADLAVQFVASARVGPVRASGRVLRMTPRRAIVQVDAFDDGRDNRLVATSLYGMTAH
jgi:uncharacterized protein (TIGR00369 family)